MTRKTNFGLVFSVIHKNPKKKDSNQIHSIGELILTKGYTPVCEVEFWIEETHIYIVAIDVHQDYRRCSYGKLTMDYMKFLAEVQKKPIILNSTIEAIGFYENLGMEHLNSIKMKRKIVVINANPLYHKEEWSDEDFIWIPRCLRNKRKIQVYA